jgi:hypothetical protein
MIEFSLPACDEAADSGRQMARGFRCIFNMQPSQYYSIAGVALNCRHRDLSFRSVLAGRTMGRAAGFARFALPVADVLHFAYRSRFAFGIFCKFP